jgi:4-hydroxybenzoate polyprenyltransferase/phosphoserine phosphatase
VRLPQSISNPVVDPAAPAAVLRPLCVDLDGTLVKSDTLVDSLLMLLRTRPVLAFQLIGRVLQGKAAFKAFVTDSISLDVAHLPYSRRLLQFLQRERERGRELYLATGADVRLARRVADHLGIFAGVLGSDGATNLTGSRKLETLRARLHSPEFDYIGNDSPDLPLLSHAPEPMVANPTLRLRMKLRARGLHPAQTFLDRAPLFPTLFKTVRLHQWAKNLLVFVPLLCSHALSAGKVLTALAAFFCFSLAASSAYIVNDLADIEADRRHAQKHQRPFAAGDLSPFTGISIAAIFIATGLADAAFLPGRFFAWLLVYLATTVAYTMFLKRFALVDVLALAGLYILRLLAGSAVTQTPISHWLAGFSMFLFLSLAFVKRFAELKNLRDENAPPANGRGYLVSDLDQLRSFGTASAYAAVVVFAIYITGSDVAKLYRHQGLLWLSVPLITLWLNRVWLLAARGELDEDPLAFALTDPMSVAIAAAVLVVALLAI